MRKSMSMLCYGFVLCLPLVLPFVTVLAWNNKGYEIPKVATVVGSVALLCLCSLKQRSFFQLNRTQYVFWIWVLWNVLCSIVNQTFISSLSGEAWYGFGLGMLGILGILQLVTRRYVDQRFYKFLWLGIVLTAGIHVVVAFIDGMIYPVQRWAGIFGEPNWFGSFMMLGSIGCVGLILESHPLMKKISVAAISLFAITMCFSGSRSSIITTIIAILLVVLLKQVKGKNHLLGIISIFFWAVLLIPFLIGVFAPPTEQYVSQRFLYRGFSSSESRFWLYQKALRLSAENPLMGRGWDQIAPAYRSDIQGTRSDLQNLYIPRSHNLLFDFLITGGVPSVFLFLCWIYFVWYEQIHQNLDIYQRLNITAVFALLCFSLWNPISISHWVILMIYTSGRSDNRYDI